MNLLEEEMRRTLSYCRWRVSWWSQQTERLGSVGPALAEGLVAYAMQQMSFETRRAATWETKWFSVRSRAHLIKQLGFGEEESTASVPEVDVDLDDDEDWDGVEGDDDEDDEEEPV